MLVPSRLMHAVTTTYAPLHGMTLKARKPHRPILQQQVQSLHLAGGAVHQACKYEKSSPTAVAQLTLHCAGGAVHQVCGV